jgi:hypothetical protein
MDWIHLAQEGEQWQTLVNTVMNLRFSLRNGEFLDQLSEY